MKTSTLVLIVIAALLLIIGGCGCGQYNSIVTADQGVKTAWSNVEANYQRRTDLYSSVVKTVSASANFEKSTLQAVVEARAKATSITVNTADEQSLAQFQQAQGQLQGAFSRLLANVEAYPQLKTTDAFQNFQAQIEGTENRINIARRDYNTAVNDYNLKVKRFPGNIFAGIFGYHEKPFYKADPGSEKNPDINFDIK
ncbi:MAG TPA: LemA family protein [Chitinophagaceae bacterium]|nr:LemA family protein [Chitinophagaceae bacterium]